VVRSEFRGWQGLEITDLLKLDCLTKRFGGLVTANGLSFPVGRDGPSGLTILLNEQIVNFAMHLAEHVHVLETGKSGQSGTAEELQDKPFGSEAKLGTQDNGS